MTHQYGPPRHDPIGHVWRVQCHTCGRFLFRPTLAELRAAILRGDDA